MIAIIDNYDSFTYNLYQAIASHYPEVSVFRNDKITLAELEQLSPRGIVLSPGPGRPENAGICIELVKKFAASIPILGVCLGHQAIAAAFGAEIIPADEIVHGKPTFVFHRRDPLFAKMPLPFKAGRYHSLVVNTKTLPAAISITAENENGLTMAIKHNTFPCYGIQFHPESILTPQGNQFLTNFLELCQCKQNFQRAAC